MIVENVKTPTSAGKHGLTTSVVPVRRVVLARGVLSAEQILAHRDAPLDVCCGETSEIILDFGRETVGGLQFECEAPQDVTVDVFYGEDLTEALRETDYTQGWYSLPHDRIIITPHDRTCQTPGRRAFRYVRLKIAGPLELRSLSAWFEHYPVTLRGSFSCDDVLLNQAWTICEHTTRCCMQRYYEDGVKRDGLLWIGDYRVAYLCNAYLYADAELARTSLELIARTQQDDGRLLATAYAVGANQHPDRIDYMGLSDRFMGSWSLINYTADFVCALRELQLFSGSESFIQDLWPVTRKTLAYLRSVDVDQCVARGKTAFIIEEGKGEGWQGSKAALAMQLLEAQKAGHLLAETLGDDEESQRCGDYVKTRTPVLRSRYIDGTLGCISDGTDEDSLMMHATAQAICADLHQDRCEAAQWTAAARANPRAQRPRIGFAVFYWLAALFRAGRTSAALDEAREYWGLMLRNNATSCWGTIDLDEPDIRRPDTHALSHCHGWSAGLAYLLPTHVLGVQSVSPAWRDVVIRPDLGDLQWAEGTIPLPDGSIHVAWERTGESVRGQVDVDSDATVTLDLGSEQRTLQRGRHDVSGIESDASARPPADQTHQSAPKQ
jgi:hypothetical protein